MAKLWQNQGLNQINTFLSKIELQKSLDEKARAKELKRLKRLASELLLNPDGFNTLEESNIWCRTNKEDEALTKFRDKIMSYKAQRDVQRKAISFARGEPKKYIKLNEHAPMVDQYIDASNFWKKNFVEVTPKGKKERIKVVYASNEEMECIIFEYLKEIIITTVSSFENHLRNIEGKVLKKKWVVEGSKAEIPIPQPVKHKDVETAIDLIKVFNQDVKGIT